MTPEEMELCQDDYTYFECYVLDYSSDPGGTVDIRVWHNGAPEAGHDVMLPSGVVCNFDQLGEQAQDEDMKIIGILKSFVERHGTLSDYYTETVA